MKVQKTHNAYNDHYLQPWLPLCYYDIHHSSLLPENWYVKIHSVVNQYAQRTILTGDSETSFESNTRLPVDVLDGNHVKQHLPWLFDLYYGDFLDFIRHSFGNDIYPSNEQNTAININKLSGIGARYEWHVDTNSVTGLLFVDDIDEDKGGALIFSSDGKQFKVQPKRGRFYCFLTEDLAHAVEPLCDDRVVRLSLPMNYYFDQNNQGRDDSVHQYLTRLA